MTSSRGWQGVVVLACGLLAVGLMPHVARTGDRMLPWFSHRLHVVDGEIDCLECHPNAPHSQTGSDDLLPAKEVCAGCHDVDDVDACTECHAAAVPEGRFERILSYSTKFSHAAHLTAGRVCADCHADIREQESAAASALPPMAECTGCHRTAGAPLECLDCHLPQEDLRPADHGDAWPYGHQDVAANERDRCAECHRDDMCQACHEGDNLFQETHPANFEYDHAFAARGRETDCAVCHEAADFCAPCHRENLVLPHPIFDAEWSNAATGGRHQEEAERDLATCMACHDEGAGDPICAGCHQDGRSDD